MPKIRIRERDKTAGTAVYDNENVIFLVDTKATEIPVLLDSTNDVTEYDQAEAIADIISFGGKVVVCKTYENAKEYLKDRNQFNIKLLMVDEEEKTVEEDTEDQRTHADLKAAVEIATHRRDCAVVYTKTTPTYSEDELGILNAGVGGDDSFMSTETKNSAGKYVLPFYGQTLTDGENQFKAGLAYVLAFLNVGNSTGAEWLAVAGAKRGVIPGKTLGVGFLTEAQIDEMQPRTEGTAINPIVKMNPWGVRIWGNRTALTLPTAEGDTDLVASSFANLRILMCDIKKQLYRSAKQYQFEQNTDVLWVNFQSSVNTLLEEMVQSYGIAGYKWIREETSERAKLKAMLRIIPIEPVEDFDLTLELVDSLEVTEE